MVVICSPYAISHDLLSELGWRLQAPAIDLLVTPDLGRIAGPRTIVRAAQGLQLVHLDEPQLSHPELIIKRTVDIALAIPALLVSLPFFVQDRIGLVGRPFRFIKFRSMVDGADARRHEVLGPMDHQRLVIKPGITGIWLVSGRKELSWDERMQLDLQYVAN